MPQRLLLLSVSVLACAKSNSSPAVADAQVMDAQASDAAIDSATEDTLDQSCRDLITRYLACIPDITDDPNAECQPGGELLSWMRGWATDFAHAYAACAQTIPCDEIDNIDEVCFSRVLGEFYEEELSTELFLECAQGSSAVCRELILRDGAGSGRASECLAKWAECGQLSGDSFWSEDACLSIGALTSQAHQEVASCLTLACDDVAACLTSAGAFGW